MRSTSNSGALVAGLGLATLAGCIGDLDVGKKPNINLDQASGAGSGEGSDGEGPGATSSPPSGTTGEASSDDATTDDSTGEPPPEVSPPCELSRSGPGHDVSTVWGTVCGGSQQELVHAIAVDALGAVYVTSQVEGYPASTVLIGDDEIPSDGPPTLLVTKLAPDGEILWNRSFRGEETWWYGNSLAVCNDRVYLVASRSGPPELIDFDTGLVDGNMAVVAFDTDDGQTEWAMATGQNDDFSGGYPVGWATCRGDGVVIRGNTTVDLTLDDVMLEGDLDTVDGGFVVVLDSEGNASWGTIEPTGTTAAALGPSGELVTLGYGSQAVALTRYAANGSLTWQQSFPATGVTFLSSVVIGDAGDITIAGGFAGEVDFGLGALVNSDPPDDPLSILDGFVSRHDVDGIAVWSTTLAEPGYDYATITRLEADGTPEVLRKSPTGDRLFTTNGVMAVEVATLPGDFVQAVGAHSTGGITLAWSDPAALTPFAPALTARGAYDLTLVKLAP